MAEVNELETRRRYRRYLERDAAKKGSAITYPDRVEAELPMRLASTSSSGEGQGDDSSASSSEHHPQPLASNPPRAVLENQETVTSPRPATPHPSFRRHVDDDHQSTSPPQPGSGGARLLAISPRRFRRPQNSDKSNAAGDTLTSPGHTQGLSLPPPFSQTRRGVSTAYTAHTLELVSTRDQPAHLAEIVEAGSIQSVQGMRLPTPTRRSSLQPQLDGHDSDAEEEVNGRVPRTANAEGSSRSTNAAGDRGNHQPASSPPTPVPRTPRLRIYHDSLSPRAAASQPATPQQLPEARHQSRLLGSYTAPARRSRHTVLTRTPATGRRRRNPSPAGLRQPAGFVGLYGGTENGDEETLFVEGFNQGDGNNTDREASGKEL